MKTKKMNDSEIRISGIEALNRILGTSSAFRFLTLISREPTDYVQVSRRLYKSQTVDEIFNRASQNWETGKSRNTSSAGSDRETRK
jgi:hypothetical protein